LSHFAAVVGARTVAPEETWRDRGTAESGGFETFAWTYPGGGLRRSGSTRSWRQPEAATPA